MNSEQYKQKLEEEKIRLETEMSDLGRKNLGVPGDWEPIQSEIGVEADFADQADVIVTRDTESAIFSDLEARYDTVLAALSRIDKGIFGICNMCGGAIEDARLDADPAATTCVKDI